MAHTPGPWEFGSFYYPADGKIGTCDITPYGEFATLAHVYLPVKGRPAHGEGEANARLIAAAPDLLAACKQQQDALDTLFAMLIERSPPGNTFHPSKSGAPWDAIVAGHAAIAKAEGG